MYTDSFLFPMLALVDIAKQVMGVKLKWAVNFRPRPITHRQTLPLPAYNLFMKMTVR